MGTQSRNGEGVLKSEDVELKKVDTQGRLILPSDWRLDNLKGPHHEVYIIKWKNYLKIVPKQKGDLTKFFDEADLNIGAIGEWEIFEKRHAEKAVR